MTVEWVGFKLTFLEKDVCHDHKIDILRSLAKLQLRYVLKKWYSNRSWFWGTFHKIDVFVLFWAKHKPNLKFFYRDMVYVLLSHLLTEAI